MARKRAAPSPAWFDDPQYRAFEADIIAHPDDDTPRLVLADWLEDQNDPSTSARAEFLRVQLELARLADDDPRRGPLWLRQDTLLRKHEASWLGPLHEVARGGGWRRGFLDRLTLGVRQLMDNADALFRLAPLLHLQLLRVSQTKIPLGELAACPYFARLRGLTLSSSSLGDDKLAVLLGQANLENLQVLELAGAGAGRRALAALAGAEMPRLRRLDLSNNPLGGALAAFCSEKVRFRLRELLLASTDLQLADFSALFRWGGLAEVEKLSLSGNRLGNAGGADLAACAHLGRLRELDLSFGEIGARGMQAVADAGAFPQLRELNLTNNSIRPTGLPSLLRCAFAQQLRALRLGGNLLGDASMERLAAWPRLSRVKVLELRSNELSRAGVEALVSSPNLGSPTVLVLSDNPIGDEGVRLLAGCPRLASLRRLELSLCQLTDAAVHAIVGSPYLKDVEHLRLGSNIITYSAAQLLPRYSSDVWGF